MTPHVRVPLDLSHLNLRPVVESALRSMLVASPVPLDDDVIDVLARALGRELEDPPPRGGDERIT